MACFVCHNKLFLSAIVALCITSVASSSHHKQHTDGVYQHDFKWPVTLQFHETKTNALLGEALLKRMYARIGFTDNIIRAEIDTLFENLKDVLEKRLRKCERRRRRAGKITSYDSPYSSTLNATLANQYTPRGRNYYGTNPY